MYTAWVADLGVNKKIRLRKKIAGKKRGVGNENRDFSNVDKTQEKVKTEKWPSFMDIILCIVAVCSGVIGHCICCAFHCYTGVARATIGCELVSIGMLLTSYSSRLLDLT